MAESWGENDKAVSDASWGANDKPANGKAEKPKTAAGDLARSLKSGVEQLPGIVTGLADLPTALAFGARPFTKAADAIGEATGFQPGKWAKETQFSDGYNDSKKAVDDSWKGVEAAASDPTKNWTDVANQAAQDAGGIAGAYLKNPLYTANQVIESLPAMFAGGAVSKGLMTAGRVAGAGLTAEALASGAMGPTRKALPGYLERAVGEKMAAPIAGGVGEGVMQAGQQMEEGKDNPDQRKNAIAALWSGAGNALISMGAGRLANKLGFETAETAMAKAGDRKVATGLGAAKRIGGGVASEGLLQELPQSVQEQNWQNWAEGKPLMEGALRAGVEGALAGGIMGAGANIHPGSPAQTPPPADPGTTPGTTPGGPSPQLGYDPMAGTHTVFPDGSIVLNSDSSNGAKTVRDIQRAQRLANAANPFFGDQTPSQSMGLEPTDGPSLANAAILSVDAGLHQPLGAPLGATDGSTLLQRATKGNQPLQEAMLANDAERTRRAEAAIPFDNATEADRRAYEEAFNRPAPPEYLAMTPDERKTILYGNKEVDDGGKQFAGTKDGDILSGMSAPFKTRFAAARRARMMGHEWGIAPVADGFVARWKGPTNETSQGIQGVQVLDQSGAGARTADAKAVAQADQGAVRGGRDDGGSVPAGAVGQSGQPAAGNGAGSLQGTVATPAKDDAKATTSSPPTPAAGLPATGPAAVQAAGVSSQPSDDQIITGKRAAYQALKKTGAPEDVISASVIGYQEKADEAGAPMTLWRSKDGALGLVPAANKSPFALGEKIGTIYPTPQSDNVTALQPQGTTANVPQPAQPGTQASQAPSAQGAPKAGTAVAPTIDEAAHQAATSPANALPQPTDGQKKAGNYAKGHVNLNGLDLSIENPAGSTRSGTDKDGKAWKNTLKHHYGYIKGTVGNDKDHVDLFVKPETPLDYSGTVFVIDQHHPHNGRFDEHKVMVGFDNEAQAKKAYHANYAKGWKGMKSITPMTFDAFKAWVKDGAKNTPVSKDPSVSIQPQGATSEPQADQAQQAATQRTETPAEAGTVTSGKRRGEVGGKLAAGEVVTTATGRDTTPFPKINLSSGRATGMTLKATAKWLMDNAIEEAKARGDKFAQRQFEAGQKNPQQADKDGAEEYLFGQTVAPVPKPFLKPLVDPGASDQQTGPAKAPLPNATAPEPDQAQPKPEAPAENGRRADGEPTAEQIAAIGDITIEIPTDTGPAKMTVNATKALAAIDERLDALEMVKRCLA